MQINAVNLKFSIPSAVKWTVIADVLTIAARSLNYVPSTLFGIPTLPFITVAAATLVTWEAYAIRQEAAIEQPSGSTITVTHNSAIGAVEAVGAASFTVGQSISAAFISPEGTKVQAGAVYIGQGEFELNGNYYA